MNKVLRFLAALAAISFIAACTANTEKLDGSQWRLISLNGKELPANIEITLEFKDGRIGGKGACNGYGADYTQKGSKLEIGPAVSTMMYCEGVMDIETEHFKAFGEVVSFSLAGEKLYLLSAAGEQLLVFGKYSI